MLHARAAYLQVMKSAGVMDTVRGAVGLDDESRDRSLGATAAQIGTVGAAGLGTIWGGSELAARALGERPGAVQGVAEDPSPIWRALADINTKTYGTPTEFEWDEHPSRGILATLREKGPDPDWPDLTIYRPTDFTTAAHNVRPPIRGATYVPAAMLATGLGGLGVIAGGYALGDTPAEQAAAGVAGVGLMSVPWLGSTGARAMRSYQTLGQAVDASGVSPELAQQVMSNGRRLFRSPALMAGAAGVGMLGAGLAPYMADYVGRKIDE